MKKLHQPPLISNRRIAFKENQEARIQCKRQDSVIRFEESIDQWKEITDRFVLTDTTNLRRNKKHSLPSRIRFSMVQPAFAMEQDTDNKRKLSEIEILKRQAVFLQNQNLEEGKATTQITQKAQMMQTEPACTTDLLKIQLGNWLKTASNGFFRSQQRHSTLEKKRTRIKKLRKTDLLKMNLMTQSHTKVFREQFFEQIQDVNKPMVLYPLLDTVYQQEVEQRLKTSSVKNKRALRRQKNSSSACRQSRQPHQEHRRRKTVGSWKSEIKLSSNTTRLEGFDSLKNP